LFEQCVTHLTLAPLSSNPALFHLDYAVPGNCYQILWQTGALQLLKRVPDLGIIEPLASSCNIALTVGRKREAHSCLPSMALRG
jgi:hypothetical protein